MKESPQSPIKGETADYGYDRPDFIVKYSLLGAVLIVAATIIILTPVLTGWVANAALAIGWSLGIFLIGFGLTFVLSKRGKLKQRDMLLDAIPWRGDEWVLDVGCGPGLLLIGAATRLSTGKAFGIDVWVKSLETNNSTAAALRNAHIEGVGDRVEVKEGARGS